MLHHIYINRNGTPLTCPGTRSGEIHSCPWPPALNRSGFLASDNSPHSCPRAGQRSAPLTEVNNNKFCFPTSFIVNMLTRFLNKQCNTIFENFPISSGGISYKMVVISEMLLPCQFDIDWPVSLLWIMYLYPSFISGGSPPKIAQVWHQGE